MPGTITLSRGERLSLLCTAKTDGVAITLDSSWSVAAAIAENGGTFAVDLEPTIVLGKVAIDFDTVDLRPANYVLDLRFTNASRDQFTQKIKVVILPTITSPSPR
jgi:hypothetical protein